jgi:hypothetical protein
MPQAILDQPTRNKNWLWQPCLLTDQDEISNLYRGPSIDASYQVSVQLAKQFQGRKLARSSLTYIPFLAHLTWRAIATIEHPSVVSFLNFNQLLWNHWANLNQIWWNGLWVVPFQNCVRQSPPRQPRWLPKSVDILLKDNLIRNLKKKLHQNQTKINVNLLFLAMAAIFFRGRGCRI